MPDDDSMLGQNLVDVRNEERIYAGRDSTALHGLDDRRSPCRCRPWEQTWRAESPHRCCNCGGLFDPKTVPAREARPGDTSSLTPEERADIEQDLNELADLIATPPLDIVHMGRRREYVSRAEAELRRLQEILDA